jgi:CMP-2-keto-3-deoxyoctulosonic acid synthetase
MTSTIDARKDARDNGTYDVYIDIDIDCEELLDATGLKYTTSEDDETQNEVKIVLDYDEFTDVFEQAPLAMTNEQTLATAILNHELGEYTTRVQVYTPQGDKITFS